MLSFLKKRELLSWGPVLSGFLGFIFSQIIFFYLINGHGFPYGIKWIVLSSLGFAGLLYLFKSTKIFLSVFLAYTLILHANLLYFRSYGTLIPLDSFHIKLSDLFSLTGSAAYSLRIQDILLYLPVLLMFVLYLKTKKLFPRLSFYPPLACLSLLLLAWIFYIYPRRMEINKNIEDSFRWDQTQGNLWFGFPGYIYYSLTHYEKDYVLTPEEIKQIENYIFRQKSPATADSIPKNILLVIVESLEAFPLNKTIDDQEITPFLNSLLKDSLTFYTDHIVTQVKDGMSSDGQLMLNTGLLPIQKGAACYLPHRSYHSLPAILKEQNNYKKCITILGHSPSMWNQANMCATYHYDQLYSENDFDQSDSFHLGMSDFSLIEQALPIIKNLPQPFLVQLITISSHSPFEIPETKRRIHIADSYHPDLARYLESINYADYALSELFNKLKNAGLLKNTALIITGDHYAFAPFFRKDLTKNKKAREITDSTGFLPLIVFNGETNGYYAQVTGQIDIFPTLIDILNLQSSWTGLGNSMLGTTPPVAAINAQQEIIGDTTAACSAPLQKIWEISDLIIRGNYFALKPLSTTTETNLGK